MDAQKDNDPGGFKVSPSLRLMKKGEDSLKHVIPRVVDAVGLSRLISEPLRRLKDPLRYRYRYTSAFLDISGAWDASKLFQEVGACVHMGIPHGKRLK